MVSQIVRIEITIVESEIESLLLEAYLIKKFQPKYNIRMMDGKSYPLIQISSEDKYPAVLFARKPDNPHSVYFGPYPNSGSVKMVLRLLRRAFPYVSVRNHPKRICLYHHLGLCPCPQVLATDDARKVYRKNIRKIIAILEGKSQKILKDLVHERDLLMTGENFEEAQDIQKQIDALSYITQPFRQGFEYDVNPNLRTDLRQKELDELSGVLSAHGLPVAKLGKIECYDISNIQGTNATGSMVVFVGGEKESNLYRKYKIRRESTPDDFASMEEVLTRRLKHTEWVYPDLIVVDGGKGQITSAMKALAKYNLSIPLIGLAKREETIIIPASVSQGQALQEKIRNSVIATSPKARKQSHKIEQFIRDRRVAVAPRDDKFIEVSLSKESHALLLLRRIRDEAHRFAITYHRKLRSKASYEL